MHVVIFVPPAGFLLFRWVHVERYARVGPVVCVSNIARSSVVPLSSLERMRMEPRVRISTRHHYNASSLPKGLHIMSKARAAAMLSRKMTTPILCVDSGTPPWKLHDCHSSVSFVRLDVDPGVEVGLGYEYRRVRLSSNYSRSTSYRRYVLCKGWVLSAMPRVLQL